MKNRPFFNFILFYLIARLLEFVVSLIVKQTEKDQKKELNYDQAAQIHPTHKLLVFHNMVKPSDRYYDLRKALKHYSFVLCIKD